MSNLPDGYSFPFDDRGILDQSEDFMANPNSLNLSSGGDLARGAELINGLIFELKQSYSSKIATEVSLGNQIDSLRDELAGMRATIEANDATIESLRKQLAGANEKVKVLESKLCPGCHGKGYYESDPAQGSVYKFQCNVCEGRGNFK